MYVDSVVTVVGIITHFLFAPLVKLKQLVIGTVNPSLISSPALSCGGNPLPWSRREKKKHFFMTK